MQQNNATLGQENACYKVTFIQLFYTKKQQQGESCAGKMKHHILISPFPLFILLPLLDFFFLTTVLSQWDFSHGKFGLQSPGKASFDTVTLPKLLIHRTLPWTMGSLMCAQI